MQKHVNLVDLAKSFPTNIYLQNLASIQKRTSPVKFAHLAERSGKGSISNLSTKVHRGEAHQAVLQRRTTQGAAARLHGLPLPFAGDFVRLELGPEGVLRTSLREGKDQYYILRQDDARIPWQAFGQPVDNDWFPDEPAVRDGAP